jgi:hypothetical protein
MDAKRSDDQYSEQETVERHDRPLRRSLEMPHKPHQPPSGSKPKTRAASKGRVRKGRSRI